MFRAYLVGQRFDVTYFQLPMSHVILLAPLIVVQVVRNTQR